MAKYYKNIKMYRVAVPTYSGSTVEVPPDKYIQGSYYADLDTLLDCLIEWTGATPSSTDVVYDYDEDSTSRGSTPPPEPWVRNSSWLELPDITGQEKIVALHAIFKDANFVALSAAGNYTVDWGDGTVENVLSGVQANHEYNYSTYDVANATLGTTGSLTYKQAIITVIPNGGNLTSINLHLKRPTPGLLTYSSGYLDIAVNAPNLTTFSMATVNSGVWTTNIRHLFLEKFTFISKPPIASLPRLFSYCSKLSSVPVFDTSSATDFNGMFNGCTSLTSVPLIDTSSATVVSSMFSSCTSLTSVPSLDISSATDFTSMFSGCTSLTSVPPLSFPSSNVNCSSMFNGCKNLTYVSLLNLSSVTNLSGMFRDCTSLTSVPLFNTSSATSVSSMFSGCTSLTSVPLFNFSSVTSAGESCFSGCLNLSSAAVFNMKRTINYLNCKLSVSALDEIFTNLGIAAAGSQEVQIAGTYPTLTTVLKSNATTIAGSTTISLANTSSLFPGMYAKGTGVSTALSVTIQTGADTITRVSHGFPNGHRVGFVTLVTSTGIAIRTPYYVINTAPNTFQLSLTLGGDPIDITGADGTGTINFSNPIVSVGASSFEVTIPSSASGTISVFGFYYNASIAELKGWGITT